MNRGTRRTVTGVALLVAVVVGLTGCVGRRQGTGSASGTADAEYVVASRDVSAGTSVSGTIRPLQSVTLTAQVQGTITAVYKKEGDTVKAGEVIAQIDSAARNNQLAQAESNYRASLLNIETANTTDLTATKTQLETALKQAQIQELQSENNLKNATIYNTSATTAANLQEAITRSEETLSTDRANLKYIQDSSTSSVLQSNIAVQQAQLNMTAAEDQLVADAQVPGKDTTADLAKVNSARLSLESATASAASDTSVTQNNLKLEAAQLKVNQDQRAVTANLAERQKTIDSQANNVDVLKADVDSAKAAVTAAQYNLSQFGTTQRKAAIQLQLLQEQKNQAELSLKATQLTSDNYVVKAPWNGTVLAVNVNVGDMATPQTSLVKVAQTQAWNVEAYVDEVDILSIKEGQKARVAIDPYPGKEFAGMVSYLGKTLVKTPEGLNAYALKIRLTTPPATLVDGMAGDATVILSTARGVLAIPVESLLSEGGKKYVMLITKNARGKDITTKTEIFTGLEGDEYVQVTSGLKTGDKILRQPVATKTPTSSGSPFMGGQ